MNTKKIIVGGLIGGVAYFIVSIGGWMAFYGDMFTTHCRNGLFKTDAETNFPVLIVANLLYGLLLSYVLHHMGGMNLNKGVVAGTVIGLLYFASFDLTFYSASHLFKGYKIVALDILLYAVYSGITGAAVGAYFGRSSEAASR